MKPVESNISPYLQQPLRTFDEVRQERERRQRELAALEAKNTLAPAPSSAPNDNVPAAPLPAHVDQTA